MKKVVLYIGNTVGMLLYFKTAEYAQQSTFTYDTPGNLTAMTGTHAIALNIATQPQSALIYSNSSVTLSALISGACLYYWLHSNRLINGAARDFILIPCLCRKFLDGVVL
jgi:hypothetical protein